MPITMLPGYVAKQLLIIAYGRSPDQFKSLNEFRANLYVTSVDLRALPPTEDAFHQHVLRAILQKSIGVMADKNNPHIPNPLEFGWCKENNELRPIMMTKPATPPDFATFAYCKTRMPLCYNGETQRESALHVLCRCGAKPDTCHLAFLNQSEIE